MGLIYTGQEADMETGHSIGAKDANSGERVIVHASREAIQDYGPARVREVAEVKYDSGDLEPDGKVFVRTSDFDPVGNN